MKVLVEKSSSKKDRKQEINAVNNQSSLPNSLMLNYINQSVQPEEPSPSLSNNVIDLESILCSRLPISMERSHGQSSKAESEADRLSSGIDTADPQQVKEIMGRKMGADFSGVRFHTDSISAAKADSMGARAYTVGNDVYFGSQGFVPEVAAHELVHTVQQGAVPAANSTEVSAPLGSVQPKLWDKKNWDKAKQLAAKAGKATWSGIKTGAGYVGKGLDAVGNAASAVKKYGVELPIGFAGEIIFDALENSKLSGKIAKKGGELLSGVFDWAAKRSGDDISSNPYAP